MPGRYLLVGGAMLAGTPFAPAHSETIQITIDKLEFSPAVITVKAGDTIEWINKDILAHTATVRGDWDVMIPPKKTAGLVLKRAGSFEYFCRFHPNMKGRINVVPN